MRFFLSNVWIRKREGVIYQDGMKRVSGGALISLPVGLFLASKSSTGPPFSSPLRSLIVNSTRTNFSPHWKKCSFSCRSVFGLKQHWDTFFFLPWDRTPDTVFCSCGSAFCPKATLENVVPVGVFFLAWSSTGQGVKLRRSQVERARSLQDDFFWRTAGENIWEFRTTDIKVRRFEHMRVCEWEGVRVWRWENLQMWRGHKIKKGCENERMRLCEELKVWGQEYK